MTPERIDELKKLLSRVRATVFVKIARELLKAVESQDKEIALYKIMADDFDVLKNSFFASLPDDLALQHKITASDKCIEFQKETIVELQTEIVRKDGALESKQLTMDIFRIERDMHKTENSRLRQQVQKMTFVTACETCQVNYNIANDTLNPDIATQALEEPKNDS